jgi:hypothetical protein
MTPGEIAALQVQINDLGDRMAKGFDEIKQMLRDFDIRTRAIEQLEAGCQPLISSRIDAVVVKMVDYETRLAAKSQQINTLEKQVSKMAGMYRGLYRFSVAVGTALVISLGGFIWALITHQAMVVFK